MKTYHVVIEPMDGYQSESEFQAQILHMEYTFTIGDRAPEKDPEVLVRGFLRDSHLFRYVKVTELREADTSCAGIETAPDSPPLTAPESGLTDICEVCRKSHSDAKETVRFSSLLTFYPGHEYVIRTKTSQQKYAREWRMGYIGFGMGMQFSARGPDRTHGGQYGGTQQIDLAMIIGAREVERDDSLRYTGKVVK